MFYWLPFLQVKKVIIIIFILILIDNLLNRFHVCTKYLQ